MNFKELSLDWDYYMLSSLKQYKEQILILIKQSCEELEVLETQKGINIIGKLKGSINLSELLLLRLYCFDDIFRIRNEICKSLDQQGHRINRIWRVKDGIKKETIFQGKAEALNIDLINHYLWLIEKKKPSEVKK